jgi:tetratricopeptide (TPR) repeat protein
MASASTGKVDEAITIMQKAANLEEAMGPPSGPPIKPSHELYGELLLRAGRHAEAAQQFATSLFRHPNRARSLIGAARADAQSGKIQGAMNAYGQFLRQWHHADAQLPLRNEARDYLQANAH